MCGIFGFAKLNHCSYKPDTLAMLARFLVMENQKRGSDSTGIGTVDIHNFPFLIRKTKEGQDFLMHDYVNKKFEMNLTHETRKVFGHTRFATTGEVTVQNAQPFIYRNILGVHNGCISNYSELFKREKLKPQTTCDSEIIFALLSTARTNKQKVKALRKLQGSYAIAFHDFALPGLHFFARYLNPLTVAKTIDNQLLLWSSEEDSLRRLEAFFRLPLKEVEIDTGYMTVIDMAGNATKRKIREVQTYNYRTQADYYHGQEYCVTRTSRANEALEIVTPEVRQREKDWKIRKEAEVKTTIYNPDHPIKFWTLCDFCDRMRLCEYLAADTSRLWLCPTCLYDYPETKMRA